MGGRDYMAREKPKIGFRVLQDLFEIAFCFSLVTQTKICFAVLFTICGPDVGSVGIRVFWIPSELKVEHFSNVLQNYCLHFSDKY